MMADDVANGLIDYLHATNPEMATALTRERLNFVMQITSMRAELDQRKDDIVHHAPDLVEIAKLREECER